MCVSLSLCVCVLLICQKEGVTCHNKDSVCRSQLCSLSPVTSSARDLLYSPHPAYSQLPHQTGVFSSAGQTAELIHTPRMERHTHCHECEHAQKAKREIRHNESPSLPYLQIQTPVTSSAVTNPQQRAGGRAVFLRIDSQSVGSGVA